MQNICLKIQEKGLSNTFPYTVPKKSERVAKNSILCVRHEQDKGTVEGFLQYLLEDGKSPKTIESYIGDVKGFLTYLESRGVNFENVLSRFYVTSYRGYLIENDFKPATINKKINSLQSFNYYLIEKGYMKENIINLRKDRVKIATGSEQQVEVFSERLVEKLLFYIQDQHKVSHRDKMIILLLLFTGVRVSELCHIKIKNIDFLTGHLKILGKGGKIREIPLKPHTFRHTFCTRLIRKGVPLTTVSKLAGHSNIETTAKFYINSSKEEKIKAVSLL